LVIQERDMAFVRLATSDDYSAISPIDEWREVSQEVIKSGMCMVAGQSLGIEAYAITSVWFGSKPFVSIIFVAERARRRGLGSALLSAIEARHRGRRLWITTGMQNIAMQNLLSSRGYELCGKIEKLAKVPELVYSRSLGSEAGPHISLQ
jgi:GNAT superfamily N-acetyltransferase